MHEAAESIPARVRSLAAPRTDLGGDTDALDWRSDERREVLPYAVAFLSRRRGGQCCVGAVL
jgi:hypothetical protein